MVRDFGVVFWFWNEPVSVMIPVRSAVAISSVNGDLFGESASKTETKISEVEVAVSSTKLIFPK